MIRLGIPYTSHYFDCCLVSGVWKDTADLSIVTILSNIDIVAVDHLEKLLACPHLLLLNVVTEKFGDPSC